MGIVRKTVQIICFTIVFYVTAFRFVGCILFLWKCWRIWRKLYFWISFEYLDAVEPAEQNVPYASC